MNLEKLNGNISSGNNTPPPINSVRRRSKLGFTTNDKKASDDEFMAAAIGDTEWLRQSLRNNGGAINYDKNGLAPIHLSAIHGRLDCLRLLVEKFKVDVDLSSTTGWRPMHLAISNQTGKRSFNCLNYLLSKGGDPSATNEDGLTPMHQAASEGHVQCMKALIDAGADIDREDTRGHKPIDLAKLWGHKKCGRILAAEMWHRDKDFIAKEMNQLKKVKMQQVLREIEEDEEHMNEQQFYGDTAFKQWLEAKALPEKTTAPPSLRKKDSKGRKSPAEKRAPLHKANSMQRPPSRSRKTPETPASQMDKDESIAGSIAGDTGKPKAPEVKFIEPEEPTKESEETKAEDKDKKPTYVNPTPWNKSPKAPTPEYVKILPDHYPRDVYTSLPKFPAQRKRATKAEEEGGLPQSAGGVSSADSGKTLRMPKLPADVLEKALSKDPAKKEKRVVFKCENIIDVQNRKHYDPDDEGFAKPEIGLHLTNQLDSPIFKAALQPERIPTTPSTIISGMSSSRSSMTSRISGSQLGSVRVDVASVKSLMGKLSKTADYAELKIPDVPKIHSQLIV